MRQQALKCCREETWERDTKRERDLSKFGLLESWHWSCETLRGVFSMKGIINLKSASMAVIDVQRGATLNNLHHAGRPRASRWAPVCLWVVPQTRYPCRNSVEANGLDWGIGLSVQREHSFFLPSVLGTPSCTPCYTQPPCSPIICQWWLSPLEYGGVKESVN